MQNSQEWSGVTVRTCTRSDVETITATEHPGARIAERMFARQERGESLYLVAWLDGVPVGAGELVFAPLRELRSLHVDESLRGGGIGTAIVRAAERASVEAGEPDDEGRRLTENLKPAS